MGTCFYLWRDDNHTAYDLGKAWEWGWAFGYERRPGRSDPMTLSPEDAPELAELLLAHLVGKGYVEPGTSIEYYAFVCGDIARWSQGQIFEFISEHDHRYEDANMEAYDRDDTGRESVVTGSRFDAWRDRGPRCKCDGDPHPHVSPGYCVQCLRYKSCPICGKPAAMAERACNDHRHRAGKEASKK